MNNKTRENNCVRGKNCICCQAEKLAISCGDRAEAKQFEYGVAHKLGRKHHNRAERGSHGAGTQDSQKAPSPDQHAERDMSKVSHMDHEAAMTSPRMAKEMEADMRRRFWISLALSIPVLIFSPIGTKILGYNLLNPALTNSILLILTTPIVFWTGSIFTVGAYNSLKNKKLNMSVLVATGVLASYLFSVLLTFTVGGETFYEAAAMLVTFVLFGHWMEMRSRRGTSEALRALFDLVPPRANVLRDGKEITLPSAEIIKGDIVIIRPGDKIPVDGKITEGETSIDESLVTGESMPKAKKTGDTVVSGSVNQSGEIKFQATKVGSETVLAQIIALVEKAQNSKAPGQRIADKAAGYLVVLAIGSGLITFLIWFFGGGVDIMTALTFAISAIVIACPDALGLATPTAVAVGTGIGAKHNVLIKDAATLENTSKINTIILDKTGTLTEGKPIVTDIVAFGKFTGEDVLKYEAAAESGSNHPLAKAIIQKARSEKIEIPKKANFKSVAGLGLKAVVGGKKINVGREKFMEDEGVDIGSAKEAIESLSGEGKTLSLLSVDGKLAGVVALADTIKPSAQKTISEIKKMAIEPVMITGDNKQVARAIAQKLGIERFFAEVLPREKANFVKKLQGEGRFVAMVGDGINDAPALAQANIGIAIGAGTDVAKETGNIVLMKSDPYDIVSAIILSRATVGKMKQNLFWASIYNILAIPVAAGIFYNSFGLMLRPEISALLMSASSIIVATNAVLLKRVEPRLKAIR